MKRSKDNIIFWNRKISDLFKKAPRSQLTEHRNQAVRACLVGTYPWIEKIDKVKFIEMLANADYVARKMRKMTEGKQEEIKRQLEKDFLKTL